MIDKLKIFFNSRIGIIALAALIVTIPFYISTVQATNHAREGCQRLNANRIAEYNYLKGDLKQRNDIIQQDIKSLKLINGPHPIKAIQRAYGIKLSKSVLAASVATTQLRIKTNKGFIKNDQIALTSLIHSAANYANNIGYVKVNCTLAYPQPWPLNYFD